MRCHTSLGKASTAPVIIASQTFVRVEEGGRRKGDEEDEEVASAASISVSGVHWTHIGGQTGPSRGGWTGWTGLDVV